MSLAPLHSDSELSPAALKARDGPPDDPIHWSAGGHDIRLHTDPAVFAPTATTAALAAEVLRAGVTGKRVLDLGCGSGPIAVVLACAGAGSVFASDVMPEACALARRNATLNGVADRVRVVRGDLFESVAGKRFDLIVNDVSGVAAEAAVVSSWFPPRVPLGGLDGTRLAIATLRQSPGYLHAGGELYFPVLSLSRGARILAVAREIFEGRLELVASRLIPFNRELKDHLATLERLRDGGLITFQQVRSRLCWSLEIYRATVPA